MGGFPTRSSRTSFGPTYEEERPVTNPKRELSQGVVNQIMWNVAGLSQVAPLAWFHCSVSGTTVTVEDQSLAWDPDSDLGNITFSYEGEGHYKFTFASSYEDETGGSITTTIKAGVVDTCNGYGDTGSHTGGTHTTILTDSTKSWSTDEWIGWWVWNITDGSRGAVTDSDATTVTVSALTGGSGNNWENGDEYILTPNPQINGKVHISAANEGWLQFVDQSDATAADCVAFVLILV